MPKTDVRQEKGVPCEKAAVEKGSSRCKEAVSGMEEHYADVIVDISHEKLDKAFQYRVPEHLWSMVKPGMAVEVPFGISNRRVMGYILELTGKPACEPEKIKEICGIYEKQTGVEGILIALAAWMRDYYGSTMLQALKAVLPVRQKTREKESRQIRLLLPEQEAKEKREYFRQKHQKARERLMDAFLRQSGSMVLPGSYVTGELKISRQTLSAMQQQGVISCESSRVYRNPVIPQADKTVPVTLSPMQQAVADGILCGIREDGSRPILLHGVTGSGKTEIYMELIARAVAEGKQAILLIPEIALTDQMVSRFYRRFGARVSVLHSKLSAGERYDQYERAREGLVDIMIGPRSALFTPFSKLGIIIVDEEHEDSYKSENAPRYHARETAGKRAEMEGAALVLGSATPSVESYYRALSGEYRLFTLPKRVKGRCLPEVSVVDMRQELKEGNRGILGGRLLEEMEQTLGKKQQIMLFLNRRGYAGFVSCRSCGYVMGCPHCNVSLSLHRDSRMGERLICHYCGYETVRPAVCPACGSSFIGNFQVGTQQVVEQVQKMFPRARILRMDADTTKEKHGYSGILQAFGSQEADILIGTQMIVKGHDFPNVTLVGVLAADLSLHVSDYRAAERTFQLLVQAAGRAGRGKEEGRVIIQTYTPEHYSIRAAARQDYQEFYGQEILYRRLMGYPPVSGMLMIHGFGQDEAYLQTAMEYIRKYLSMLQERYHIRVVGPADEAVSRINDIYRKVIYVRQEHGGTLFKIKQSVEQYIGMNRGFDQITVQFDRV